MHFGSLKAVGGVAAVLALAACATMQFWSQNGTGAVELAGTQHQVVAALSKTSLREVAAPGNMGVGQGKAGTAGTPATPAQAQPTPVTQPTAPTPATPQSKKVKLSQAIKLTETSADKALARASKQAVQAALLQAALSVPGQRTAAKAAAKRAAAAAANKPSPAWLAGERALGARDPVKTPSRAKATHAAKRRVAAARLRALKMGQRVGTSLAHEEGEHGAAEADEKKEHGHKLPYKIVKGHHRDDVYLKYHDDDHQDEEGEGDNEEEYVKGTRELGTPVKSEDVQDDWMEGAHNPAHFIHPHDRYVKVGGIIHPPSEEEEEEGEHGEEEEEEGGERDHEEEEGQGGDEEEEGEPAERAMSVQQLAAGGPRNSPNAPTLEGGVSVPGGKVVWLPLNSLMGGGGSAAAVSAPAASPAMAAAPSIPMPQMPAMYSKVVAYGPDGKPDAVWYGSGQWQPAAAARAQRGRQQQLNMAQDKPRQQVGRDGLTAADEAIERKVLFHLLQEEGGTSAAHAHAAWSLLLPAALAMVLAVGNRW